MLSEFNQLKTVFFSGNDTRPSSGNPFPITTRHYRFGLVVRHASGAHHTPHVTHIFLYTSSSCGVKEKKTTTIRETCVQRLRYKFFRRRIALDASICHLWSGWITHSPLKPRLLEGLDDTPNDNHAHTHTRANTNIRLIHTYQMRGIFAPRRLRTVVDLICQNTFAFVGFFHEMLCAICFLFIDFLAGAPRRAMCALLPDSRKWCDVCVWDFSRYVIQDIYIYVDTLIWESSAQIWVWARDKKGDSENGSDFCLCVDLKKPNFSFCGGNVWVFARYDYQHIFIFVHVADVQTDNEMAQEEEVEICVHILEAHNIYYMYLIYLLYFI